MLRKVLSPGKNGKETRLECPGCPVLVATGRQPNTEGLNLEAAGVAYTPKGITVNDQMLTSVPHIYAIGDVTGRQMLAHAATFMGFRAVNTIVGKTDKIRFDIMPSAIFTYPEAASVGITEDQAKQQSIDCHTLKGYYRANGKALAIDEPEGMIKLVADASGKILGCAAYGAHSADSSGPHICQPMYECTLSVFLCSTTASPLPRTFISYPFGWYYNRNFLLCQ